VQVRTSKPFALLPRMFNYTVSRASEVAIDDFLPGGKTMRTVLLAFKSAGFKSLKAK
jgi:hypothetical protein